MDELSTRFRFSNTSYSRFVDLVHRFIPHGFYRLATVNYGKKCVGHKEVVCFGTIEYSVFICVVNSESVPSVALHIAVALLSDVAIQVTTN